MMAAEPTQQEEEKAGADRDLDLAYRVLGAQPEDSDELIESIYKTKAKHLHPDISHDSGNRFKMLKKAYDMILASRKG